MDDLDMLFDKRILKAAVMIVRDSETSRRNDTIRVTLKDIDIWYKRVAHGWEATLDIDIRDRKGGPQVSVYRNYLRPSEHPFIVEFWDDLCYEEFSRVQDRQEKASKSMLGQLPTILKGALQPYGDEG